MDTEMFEETLMLVRRDDVVNNLERSKFDLLNLDADIFEKRAVITPDNVSDYSDYSKASSSNNGSFPGSKTKSVPDPKILRARRRLPSEKPSSQQPPKKSKPDDHNEDRCDFCNKKGFLLCCDFCDASFHLKCHTPSIESIPKGKFQCYRCQYKQYYNENPITLIRKKAKLNGQLGYETAYLLKELRTMRIVPFELPDQVKALVGEIPSLMPNEEFKRKFKRKKTDYFDDCYVCDKPVTVRNSNQCQFCSNTIHIDCDPQPTCSTRLYVWRCPMHIENYLDSYILDSTSTYRRVKLWSKHTSGEIDKDEVEKEFSVKLKEELDRARTVEVADTLIKLKNSKPFQSTSNENLFNYSQAEKRMLILNKSMLNSELFVKNSNAIAVFIPAFKSSISPIIYDGRPLTFGLTDSCTFNLKSLPFECSNMCDNQLKIHKKQNVNYLSCGPNRGYTRVNGTLLMERASEFTDLCQCIGPNGINSSVCSHIAIFPHKIYTIQLGCAFFYLLFRPSERVNHR